MVPYRPYPPPPPYQQAYYPQQGHYPQQQPYGYGAPPPYGPPPSGWAQPQSYAPPPLPPKKRGSWGLTVLITVALMIFCTGAYSTLKSGRERAAKLASANEKLAGKVDAAQLDAATACVLLEKEITLGLYPRTVSVSDLKCTGRFEADDKRASLRGVEATIGGRKQALTACFARGSRWFGLAVLEGPAEACPTGAFDVPAHATPATDEELRNEEGAIRAELARKAEAAELAKLETFLAKVETNIDDYEPTRKACPAVDRAATVATVDFEYLRAPADVRDTRENWSFMTSHSVKQGLDRRNTADARGKAAHAIFSSPYLVVFEAADRLWPALGQKRILRGRDLWAGYFAGWLHLVDTRTGQPACSTELVFTTSPTVKGHKDDEKMMRIMKTDLEDRFKKESANALGGLAGRNLTLER